MYRFGGIQNVPHWQFSRQCEGDFVSIWNTESSPLEAGSVFPRCSNLASDPQARHRVSSRCWRGLSLELEQFDLAFSKIWTA
jgi:hypothetical protein